MDKETAAIAMQFLNRVDMKGGEVPAFLRVMKALAQIAEPRPTSLNGMVEIEASGGAAGAAGAPS